MKVCKRLEIYGGRSICDTLQMCFCLVLTNLRFFNHFTQKKFYILFFESACFLTHFISETDKNVGRFENSVDYQRRCTQKILLNNHGCVLYQYIIV